MKGKKLFAALLALSLVGTTVAGCSKKDDKQASTTSTGGQQTSNIDKDQYVNVLLGQEPKTLDPSKATDLYSSQILQETIEGLTRIEQDENGKDVVKPAQAEKWDISQDGLTWTFHLRDNKWSDGKPVTADQYVYGIKRTLDPAIASQYAFLLYPIKGAAAYNSKKGSADAVGVKAVDDKTLEITLEGPCAYFLNITYFKVMHPQRQDLVEKYGDKFGTEANTMLSCGPFVLKEWVHSNQVVLEKNPNYWDAKSVKLQKVTMKYIKEETSAMNELLNGGIDSAGVTKPEWTQKFDGTGNFDVLKGFDPSTSYEFYNQKNKLFSNVKVRKAFSLAVNREDIAKTLYRGIAAPAYGWCPPSLQINGEDFREKANYEPLKTLADENPDPKALLIEGLKELGMDPDPAKLDVTFLESGTDARSREFAEYDQQMYKTKLGVNLKIDYVEWPVFMKRTDSMDYQIAGMAWSGDYNDPMTEFDMWMTDAGIVPTGWSNKKYDDLIKDAQGTLDQEKRFNDFKDAEKILLYDDAVIAPTVYRQRNTYSRKFLKSVMRPLFGSGSELKYAYTEGRGK